jgi:ABC-2 type transport system permease protein
MKAVAIKEMIHIIRDWRSLALAIAIPVILLLLFAYALNMDLKNIPTAVIDYSNSKESRELISLYDGSDYFNVHSYFTNIEDLQSSMKKRETVVGIVIKENFDDNILKNEVASVQIVVDGSDANTGRLSLNYAQALGVIFNTKLRAEKISMGLSRPSGAVNTEPRAWYNEGMVSTYNIVPGILAIVMVVIASMLASVTVAREWETGTMEQLISTPVRKMELILGKALPLYFIGLADIMIAVVLGQLLFHVPLRGEPALLLFVATLFLTGVLFYGLVLSISLKKQVIANQIALITGFLPTLVLSGFIFTISNMPLPIQLLTHIFPARYFVAMLRSIYLKGVGLEMMMTNFIFLLVYGGLMLVLANKKLKLRLD